MLVTSYKNNCTKRLINMSGKPAILKMCICTAMVIASCVNIGKSQENTVQPKGIYSSNFTINGLPRVITFYIPLNYGKDDNCPIVFFMHAEGESGKTILKKYGTEIQQLADSSQSIVVLPDAVKGHWNSGLGDHATADTINDVGFIAIMLDYFVQQYHGDPLRLYVAGFYNGGNMAWRLGCNLPNKIAAVAPFITALPAAGKSCNPGTYFNAGKFMPKPGDKFSNEALAAAWTFLMNNKKPSQQ